MTAAKERAKEHAKSAMKSERFGSLIRPTLARAMHYLSPMYQRMKLIIQPMMLNATGIPTHKAIGK